MQSVTRSIVQYVVTYIFLIVASEMPNVFCLYVLVNITIILLSALAIDIREGLVVKGVGASPPCV